MKKGFKVAFAGLLVALLVAGATPSMALGNIGGATLGQYIDITGLNRTAYAHTTGTKYQDTTSSTILYYSNNPETLDNTCLPANAVTLMYSNILPTNTYRVFVAHTNKSSYAANVGLLIKTTGTGAYEVQRKVVKVGTNFGQIGVDAGYGYLSSTPTVIKSGTITTQWTLIDPVVSLPIGNNVQAFYDIKITSGSGTIALAVSAARTTVDMQADWRAGRVTDAPKTTPTGEDHYEAGLFAQAKTVNLTVSLDSMAVNDAKTDGIGHVFGYQTDPVSEVGSYTYSSYGPIAYDGWMQNRGVARYNYLAGNFATIYHYNVTFSGSSARAGAILIGTLTGDGVTPKASGLIAKVGGTTTVFGNGTGGPMNYPDKNKAWMVVKGSGGTSTSFDILVPGNINLPYKVLAVRYL